MSAQSFISHCTFVQEDLNYEKEIGIEIIPGRFKVELDEWNWSDKTFDAMEPASQNRNVAPGGLLASQLDFARNAHSLSFLPLVAWLHPGRGRAGSDPDGYLHMDTLAPGICAAFCGLLSGVVALRADQWPDGELGVPGQQHPFPARILRAVHDLIFHGNAGGF